MSEKKEIMVEFKVDGSDVKLTPSIVNQYIVGSGSEITLPEFKFFSEMCKVRGLNPFLKEAYCVKYGNSPAQLIVSKDAIMKRAILNPQFDGMESGIIVVDKKGEVTERKGNFKLPDETLVGGWAKVYRKDWNFPTYCSVSFDECAQRTKGGGLNTMWATKGAMMVEKVAKVRALRETFVDQFSGMYEAEEFGVELPDIQRQPEPKPVLQPEPSQDIPPEYQDELIETTGTVSLNDL